jgi:lipase chaperone LimK
VRRRLRALAAVAAFAAFGGALWLRTAAEPATAPSFSPTRATSDALRDAPDAGNAAGPLAALATTRRTPAAADPIERLRDRLAASSLRGAEADGEVSFDADGRVRADAGLRRLFDHFLSLSGEFAPQDITALLLDHVRRLHGEQAALEVAEWFDRYVGLRAELAGARLPDELASRLAQLQAARRRWLGDDAAAAMFGEEDAHIAYTLARRALQEDPGLDAAQRERALDELEAARPAALRQAEREATAALLAEEQTRQLDALGADAALRASERSELWGPDAARRLAQLDAQRDEWARRIADYVQARERVRSDANLDSASRGRALRELLDARFDANERLRIEALESVGALPSGG